MSKKVEIKKNIVLLFIVVMLIISITVVSFLENRNIEVENDFKELIHNIELATKSWVEDNRDIFTSTSVTCLNVNELGKKNYLTDEELINPYTDEPVIGYVDIMYNDVDKIFTYDFSRIGVTTIDYRY